MLRLLILTLSIHANAQLLKPTHAPQVIKYPPVRFTTCINDLYAARMPKSDKEVRELIGDCAEMNGINEADLAKGLAN